MTSAAAPVVARRWWEWGLLAAGWATIAVAGLGVLGVIPHFGGEVPWMRVAVWTFGLAALHDLVVGPVVGVVGLVVGRLAPAWARGAIAAATVVSVLVVAVSYARLRGYGRDPGEPSFLAGDAASDVGRVVAVVWVTCAAVAVVGEVSRRRGRG